MSLDAMGASKHIIRSSAALDAALCQWVFAYAADREQPSGREVFHAALVGGVVFTLPATSPDPENFSGSQNAALGDLEELCAAYRRRRFDDPPRPPPLVPDDIDVVPFGELVF